MTKFQILLEILHKEDRLLKQLLKLEKTKNSILIDKDYNDLIHLSEKEEKLSAQLEDLEKERILFSKSEDLPLNLSDIIDATEINQEIYSKLREIQYTLVENLKTLKFYNNLNNKILSESINFFKSSLELLTGANDSNIYDNVGLSNNTGFQKAKALMLDKTI